MYCVYVYRLRNVRINGSVYMQTSVRHTLTRWRSRKRANSRATGARDSVAATVLNAHTRACAPNTRAAPHTDTLVHTDNAHAVDKIRSPGG